MRYVVLLEPTMIAQVTPIIGMGDDIKATRTAADFISLLKWSRHHCAIVDASMVSLDQAEKIAACVIAQAHAFVVYAPITTTSLESSIAFRARMYPTRSHIVLRLRGGGAGKKGDIPRNDSEK
jgi:hypothetical protein